MSQWAVEDLDYEVHVRPLGDTISHKPDDCVCGPSVEYFHPETDESYQKPLIVHYSLDGREQNER